MLVVRQRADHGGLRRRVERQHALVLEQDHRAAGCLAGGPDRVGPQHLPLRVGGRIRRVRVLEQAGAELDPEDPAHGVVDPTHRDHSVLEQLRAEVTNQGAGHLRVDPRVERCGRGAGTVGGDSMAALAVIRVHGRAGTQLLDRRPIALDEAVELPLALEDLVHRVAVRAAGNAVDRVERAHHGVGAGIDRRLERRQVHVAEALLRHVRRVVVAPGFGLSVGDEVLRARDQLVPSAVVRSLGPLHAGRAEHRVQVRVLAAALGDPAPPRLMRDVDHRRVGLLQADGRRLARAVGGVGERHVRVEARGGAQRNREGRAEAVDGVEGEQERDPEAGVLDRDPLELADPLRVRDAEDRAEPVAHLVLGDQEVRKQLGLLELLLQRHLRDQRVDAILDPLVGRSFDGLERHLVACLVSSEDADAARDRDRNDERRRDHGRPAGTSPHEPDLPAAPWAANA